MLITDISELINRKKAYETEYLFDYRDDPETYQTYLNHQKELKMLNKMLNHVAVNKFYIINGEEFEVAYDMNTKFYPIIYKGEVISTFFNKPHYEDVVEALQDYADSDIEFAVKSIMNTDKIYQMDFTKDGIQVRASSGTIGEYLIKLISYDELKDEIPNVELCINFTRW